ncbi:MAG: ribonuclease Z [Halodesulfurarchaeum sp.]|nr:ribonuclease Z [Halodesulfurarchaeum sp.]
MTLRVTFLGTSGAIPTTARNPSSIFCRRAGEAFLFDVGEGTQRQMMRFGTGFDVDAVFLTHVHGDHVLGLPGLIQTWGFNERTDPLAIYTPRGTRREIVSLIYAIADEPDYLVTVEEVTPGSTVREHEEYEIRAIEADHRTAAVGYALVEADRKGRFDRDRAEELGVPAGPKFSQLHEGEPVELEDGTVVQPEEVVGPARPGRRLVYTGDTRPIGPVETAAADADLLIHDATFAETENDRARETGHSTAREAGRLAERAGAKRLALTHVSPRYAGDTGILLQEARAAFDGEVMLAEDGQTVEIPYPDE